MLSNGFDSTQPRALVRAALRSGGRGGPVSSEGGAFLGGRRKGGSDLGVGAGRVESLAIKAGYCVAWVGRYSTEEGEYFSAL